MDELILTNISFFSGLPRLEMAKIIPAFEKVAFLPGDTIFEEGARGDSLFIIANGLVKISRKEEPVHKELAVLKNSDCFGEMALFTGEKRSASATALTHTTVFKLTKEKFDKLLKQHHFLALYFNELLSKRLAMRSSSESETPEKTEEDCCVLQEKPAEKKLFRKFLFNKTFLVLFFSLLAGGGVYLFLSQANFLLSHILFIEIILFSTLLCAFNVVSFMVASLSIPLLCVLLGITAPKAAFSGFTHSSWFFLLGFFAIAAALSKSGLLFRGILNTLLKFPANYYGQTLALFFSGVLLTPVLSSKNARIILMSPIALDLCDALNLKSNSKGTIGIAMSIFFGFGQLSFAFMNGSAFNLMMFGLLPADAAAQITWLFWLKASAVLTFCFFIFSYLTIILLYRPGKKLSLNRNIIKAQLITMGPLSRKEKLVSITVMATLVLLISQPLHTIDSAWIALGAFLFLTGVSALSEKSTRSDIDWNYLLAFGALIGVGKMITDTGLASVIAFHLGQLPSFLFSNKLLLISILALIFYFIRLILPNNSALIIFMLTFSPIVSSIGISPFVIGLIALLCMNPWFFPNQNVVFQSLYQGTEGRLFTHQQTIKLCFLYVALTFLAIFISYPYWHYLGLIK